jgi:hypothetical protein
MSKKRTKKYKSRKKTQVIKIVAKKSSASDFFGFNIKLIYQDLLKTLIVTAIVVTILLLTYLYS